MELQMWREILCPYDLAVEELKLKFVHIMNEYRTAGRYSPIEQVDGRVKSISSILDKMQRKKININEIETDLYKYKENIPEHITEKLMNAADAIVVLDKEMSIVRDEIMDAQNSFRKKANIVSEILSTMQNLYKVANKQEVIKIQDEFYKIYETGDMEQLIHFNKQLDIIAEGYRAQSLS